jgi:hypothetical protein
MTDQNSVICDGEYWNFRAPPKASPTIRDTDMTDKTNTQSDEKYWDLRAILREAFAYTNSVMCYGVSDEYEARIMDYLSNRLALIEASATIFVEEDQYQNDPNLQMMVRRQASRVLADNIVQNGHCLETQISQRPFDHGRSRKVTNKLRVLVFNHERDAQ